MKQSAVEHILLVEQLEKARNEHRRARKSLDTAKRRGRDRTNAIARVKAAEEELRAAKKRIQDHEHLNRIIR